MVKSNWFRAWNFVVDFALFLRVEKEFLSVKDLNRKLCQNKHAYNWLHNHLNFMQDYINEIDDNFSLDAEYPCLSLFEKYT